MASEQLVHPIIGRPIRIPRKRRAIITPPQVYDRRGIHPAGSALETTQETMINFRCVDVQYLQRRTEVYRSVKLQNFLQNGLIPSEKKAIIAPTDSLNLEL